jgi:DNA-binding MarR family transcriptional regulator
MATREKAFLEVGGAVRHLFHLLRAVAEAATPPDRGFTASHRGVMESLAALGPQTVPALARARPVARQHIQVLVNDLAAWGLAEARPNPAHKRSPLIALTRTGQARFDAIRAAEAEALATLELSVPAGRLAAAADDLTALARDLEGWLADREKAARRRKAQGAPRRRAVK